MSTTPPLEYFPTTEQAGNKPALPTSLLQLNNFMAMPSKQGIAIYVFLFKYIDL